MKFGGAPTLFLLSIYFCSNYSHRYLCNQRKELRILIEQEPTKIDPRLVVTSYEYKISSLLFRGLTKIDPNSLLPVEDLASSIVALSPLKYRICLKKNQRWDDGTEITSKDIAFTFESLNDPEVNSPYKGSFSYIKRVIVQDRYCTLFELSHPRASFKSDIIFPLLPSHILNGKKKVYSFEDKSIVGSGYFKFLKKERNRIYLKVKERFKLSLSDGKPKDIIVFETIRDINSMVMVFKGGMGDIAQNNIPPYLWQIFNNKEFHIVRGSGIGVTYLGFNLEDKYLKEPKVREAIAYAIDREAIIKNKFKGGAKIAHSLFPKIHWAYYKDIKKYQYNPRLSEKLLDEIGLKRRRKDQVRFSLTYITSTDKFRVAIARIIAYYLKQVGIEVKIKSYEFGILISKLNKGDFQIASLQLPQIIEPNVLKRFFHSSHIPKPPLWIEGGNRWRLKDKMVDTLLELGEKETDLEKRKKIYWELQQKLLETLPIFPLWHEDNFAILSKCAKNYRVVPTGEFGLTQLLVF